MITRNYISSISGLLAIVLIANIAIPAISNCLIMADCDMMEEMNHNSHDDMESMSMDMMKHNSSEKNIDHCDMMDNSSTYKTVNHSLAECYCVDAKLMLNNTILVKAKTAISVLEREIVDFESSEFKKGSIHQEIIDFKPDPSPPDLFINYKALLI